VKRLEYKYKVFDPLKLTKYVEYFTLGPISTTTDLRTCNFNTRLARTCQSTSSEQQFSCNSFENEYADEITSEYSENPLLVQIFVDLLSQENHHIRDCPKNRESWRLKRPGYLKLGSTSNQKT
jgi:hypothetical protein